jgi:hypothetical protein
LRGLTWYETSFVAIINTYPLSEGRKKMFHPLVLADFLYFPKDKTEYFPAVISLIIFSIGAILAMRYFIVSSKREAKKTKLLEEQIMNQQQTKKEQ